MSAQLVEDEEYQLRHERAAGIDVAKADGMVCLRLPPEPGKKRRTSRTWKVTATVPDCHAARAAGYLRVIDSLDNEIALLENQAHIATVAAAWGTGADGTTGPGAGRQQDAAVLPAVQRLAEIPGVSEGLATGLIAELGRDMSRFPTPGHLVSWAGTAPVPAQSGPRQGRGKKGHGNTCARRYATQAGNGAAGTATFLGERHQRLRSRPGGGGWKKASCAVGRSILVITWHLLSDPAARYADLGPGHYARHADRSRKARGHKRQLEALGYDVIITPRTEQAA
jgi:transposase